MGLLRVFEIHTYRGGIWRIDSVFDDRDLALGEAARVDRSGRFSAVRVIEETFDEETEKGATRTIFRSTKADKINAERRVRQDAPLKTAPAPPRRIPVKRKKSMARQLITAMILLTLIVAGGLAIIYVLNTMSGFR